MKSLPRPRLAASAVTLLVIGAVLAVYLYLSPARYGYPVFSFSQVSDSACDSESSNGNYASGIPSQPHVIPNIVHYVWLLRDTNELSLDFKAFISIYSAHLYWRSEFIYIHTDATPAVFVAAKQSGSPWTRRILNLPGITPSYVTAPASTAKGVPITKVEHKADFLRIVALRDYGGIYLDIDAVPLRDITPLRSSGFANVLGGATALAPKDSGYVNNGVMMAVPQSSLMNIYYHAAHEFFDGQWATASIHVLTDLANRLVAVPSEVLILQPSAFAPTSWEDEDQKRLFLPRLRAPAADDSPSIAAEGTAPSCRDVLGWLKQREGDAPGTDPWELDFSSTYVLHAFDDTVQSMRGWDHQVDVQYVLARQSNYARAVFPAIRDAVQSGVIPRDEVG